MSSALITDESLATRLALPLAQLYRRAHNAKNPLDRHQSAYYLWEAGLKLLGSAAIVSYAESAQRDADIDERLMLLARPSLGHWWEFVRTLVPFLADAGDGGFASVRDWLLGSSRADLPRLAGLAAALSELDTARSTVRISELFDQLVRYRNREIGHGASGQRPPAFYGRTGGALLAGMAELLDRFDLLAGRRLVFISEVRRHASGRWLIERQELIGESARRIEPMEFGADQAAHLPRPESVYAVGSDGALASLHPLLLYQAETNEVHFLASKRGRRQAEYLCYSTGSVLQKQTLPEDHRELLARVLRTEVANTQAESWAAKSQAEEAPEGPPEEPLSDRRIGEFELMSELGRGGMGVVYRAWQPSLGRQVALKCLLRSGDPRSEARFTREIHALGKVEHPHLVKVFTSGAQAENWFYTMELVEGATLAAVCDTLTNRSASASTIDLETWDDSVGAAYERARQEERPLSAAEQGSGSSGASHASRPPNPPRQSYVERVVELVRQVAEAAHALHEAGVVHRDIKPGNILVTAEGGQAVLMDLGLAQMADETEGRLTRTRQFVGTLRYASPEQVLAVAPVDRRSDVYSLGATLWELLTLRPLFGANEQTSTPHLMQRIQHEEPERPRKYHPGIPTDLEAIVLKCLEKNPGRRYATASDLAADLDRWLKGELVQAQPPTFLYVASKFARRHRIGLATTAALLFLALAGAVVAFVQIDRARRAAITQKQLADGQRTRAIAADRSAQAAAKQAQTEAAIAKETAEFLQNDLLGQASPEQNERTKKVTVEELLNRASARIEGKFADQPQIEASLRDTIAFAYQQLGIYPAATKHTERVLELNRKRLGPEHAETLATENTLADLYQEQARYAEAEKLFGHALEVSRRKAGPDDPQTLMIENNLGNVYRLQGRFAEAEPLLRHVLEGRRRVLGPDAEGTLVTENALAVLDMTQDRAAEAEMLLKHVLEGRRKLDGPDHAETIRAEANLAEFYRLKARYAEAEELYKHAIEAGRRTFGTDHPDQARITNNLAVLYQNQGRHAEAEPLLKAVLETQRKLLGRDHPETLGTENNLARHYQEMGKYREAEPLFKRIAEARNKLQGAEHPDTLMAENNLADLYKLEGRYADAEPLFRHVLDSQRKQFGPEHPDTLMAENNLAHLYELENRIAEAEPLYREAFTISKRVQGPEHPQTLNFENNLANLYRIEARYAEAEPLFQHALEGRRKVLGAEHPDTLITENNLAVLYSIQARYHEAEPLLLHAVKASGEALGPEHPSTLTAENNLARIYQDQGNLAEAERHFQHIYETSQRELGPEHPDTLMATNNLADLYRSQGRVEDAEKLFKQALEISRRVLGPDHADTLRIENNLADVYSTQLRYPDAEPLLRHALETHRKNSGPEHPDTLRLENNLANLYRLEGKFADGEALFKHAIDGYRKAFGEEHPSTLRSESNLAVLYDEAGRPAEAEPLFKHVLEVRRKTQPADDPNLLGSEGALARHYQNRGQDAQAEPLLRHVLEVQRAKLKPDDPGLASTLATLGWTLVQEGKFVDAEPILRESLTIREKRLPDLWPRYSAEALLGASLAGQQKYADAEPLLVEGYNGLAERKDKIPTTAKHNLPEALKRLISLYDAWGKPEKAAEWRKKQEQEPSAR